MYLCKDSSYELLNATKGDFIKCDNSPFTLYCKRVKEFNSFLL